MNKTETIKYFLDQSNCESVSIYHGWLDRACPEVVTKLSTPENSVFFKFDEKDIIDYTVNRTKFDPIEVGNRVSTDFGEGVVIGVHKTVYYVRVEDKSYSRFQRHELLKLPEVE